MLLPPTLAVMILLRCFNVSMTLGASAIFTVSRDLQKRYWNGVLWSPSYFASSCGGDPISIVRLYIEQQQTPH